MKPTLGVHIALVMFFTVFLLQAQTKIVSGTVFNEDGFPLPGVHIQLTNSEKGTQTNFEGKYTISGENNFSLHFTYLGFKGVTISVRDSVVIDVVMESASQFLDEVVVTALGIEKEMQTIGYAMQTITGHDIVSSNESNFINALSGRISGVQITNSSGALGASSRIILRGPASITGNNEPLFIVDDIPIDNSSQGDASASGGIDLPNGAAAINPSDIESISLLKGSNAAAIYGLRAASGVVVITTKKGAKNTGLGIEVFSSVTFENPLTLPGFQNSYGQGNTPDFFEWIDGSNGSGGIDESWGPPLDVGLSFVQWNSYTANGAPLPWISKPNNVKNFYKTGISLQNGFSLNGGSSSSTYRLSFSRLDQEGMVPSTNFERNIVSGNFSHDLSSTLSTRLTVRYIKSSSANIVSQGYTANNPTQQINGFSARNIDFSLLKDWKSLPLSPLGTNGEGTPLNWNTFYQNNIYWQLETNTNSFQKNRIIGGANIALDLTKNLSLIGRTGIDYWSSTVHTKRAIGSIDDPQGRFRIDSRNRFEINSEVLLTFEKEFDKKINITLNAGANSLLRTTDRVQVEASQLELPNIYNISNIRSGISPTLSNYTSEQRINSIYAFGQIDYKNIAFLDISARNDWASILPTNNNSFFYPSINASFILNNIFNISRKTISLLKLRGGFSEVGSVGDLAPYELQPVYRFNDTPFGTTSLALFPSTLNNPLIQPETTISNEIGMDLKLWNDRVYFNATYYNTTSKNLIVNGQVSSASGIRSTIQNIGKMKNNGIELQLGGILTRTKNFSADLNFNFSKNSNEVISLGDNQETLVLGGQWGLTTEAKVGLPYGAIVGSAFDRSPSGKIIYENGLPTIATQNKILGNVQPDWLGGAVLGLHYKNFHFEGLVDAKIGGEIYSITNTWGRFGGILYETLEGRETGVVGDGVTLTSDGSYVPNDIVVSAKQFNQTSFSDTVAESSVFDATYVKLRQLSFGFNIPSRILLKTPFKSIEFSVIGRNLTILHKNAPHIDPESAFSNTNANQGLESGQIPSSRSIGFNVNAKF